MTLLQHYLKSVRLYLPSNAAKDDIVNELAELLQSSLDDREEQLGRPLTETEQEALLSKHGNPMDVAGRYGAKHRSVSFGGQLIGPELFPLYSRILALNFGLTLLVPFVFARFSPSAPLSWRGILLPLVIQFTIVTGIFSAIDYFQRKSRIWLHEDPHWQFPPAYFQRIPRWQSLAGGLVLAITLIWWLALPFAPRLLLGRALRIDVVSSVRWFYFPVIALLVIGIAQRAVVFLRPELNWLQSVTRLFTNLSCVLLVYVFALHYPAVVAKDPSDAEMVAAAVRVSNMLWWVLVPSFGLYWLITAGFYAWLCAQHLIRGQRARTS